MNEYMAATDCDSTAYVIIYANGYQDACDLADALGLSFVELKS